ncbi:hypothetical protein [Streptococcus agalactiae]
MTNNFEIKKKIVEEGNSELFELWQKAGLLTKEEFLDLLEWVCDDPMPEGRLTREVGLFRTGYIDYNGERVFSPQGKPYALKMERRHLAGDLDKIFFIEHGDTSLAKKRLFTNIRFNARDRV